jgi:hypothetical protein
MKIGQVYNPYKLFHGSITPNWLMRITEISQGSKLCFARLMQYAGENGECFPSLETIAKEIGVKEWMAHQYIKELIKFNLIQSKRRGLGKTNIYVFIWNEWIECKNQDLPQLLNCEEPHCEKPQITNREEPKMLKCEEPHANRIRLIESEEKNQKELKPMSFCKDELNSEPIIPSNKPINKEDRVEDKKICDEVVTLYNRVAEYCSIPKIQVLTDARKKLILERNKQLKQMGMGWERYLDIVRSSSFLIGTATDFKANFDFILNKTKFIKIIEGQYNDNSQPKASKSFVRASF